LTKKPSYIAIVVKQLSTRCQSKIASSNAKSINSKFKASIRPKVIYFTYDFKLSGINLNRGK